MTIASIELEEAWKGFLGRNIGRVMWTYLSQMSLKQSNNAVDGEYMT